MHHEQQHICSKLNNSTATFVEKAGCVQQQPVPPHRPPPDYSLFLKLKLKLKRCYPHESVDENPATVSLDLDSVGEESFQWGFMNLYTRFEHYINFREDYLKD